MSSTYLSLHYHLVFGTKNRIPSIDTPWRSRLHEIGLRPPPGSALFRAFSGGVGLRPQPPANGLYPSGMMKPCSRWDSDRCSSRGISRWSVIHSPFGALFQRICTPLDTGYGCPGRADHLYNIKHPLSNIFRKWMAIFAALYQI
jgi:hypothetical protein